MWSHKLLMDFPVCVSRLVSVNGCAHFKKTSLIYLWTNKMCRPFSIFFMNWEPNPSLMGRGENIIYLWLYIVSSTGQGVMGCVLHVHRMWLIAIFIRIVTFMITPAISWSAYKIISPSTEIRPINHYYLSSENIYIYMYLYINKYEILTIKSQF